MTFITVATAMLTANLFTVIFLWGLAKAFKIGADEGAPAAVAAAIAIPALLMAVGASLALTH